jgi:hypothetical protein
MKFLEKDLEEIIYTADKAELGKKGLDITGKIFRQLNIGNYGISDLIEVNRYGQTLCITIYELKKEVVNVSTFLQAVRYAKGVSRYLTIRKPLMDIEIRICLIGKKLDLQSSFSFLESIIPMELTEGRFLTIKTYDYSINGITFTDECDYWLVDEGFNLKPKCPF